MKKITTIVALAGCLLLFSFLNTAAQVAIRTIVTQAPIVVGESFQVQYVIEDLQAEDEFFTPDFKDFRFVSGPNIYTASPGSVGGKSLKNIVYTLVALKPGKFVVPIVSARIGDKLIRSRTAWLQVISESDFLKRGRTKPQEPNEDYFLGPDEDPYAKMQHNLFMKVLVDKKLCYVGEPVTATFKLYSRLESRSDIVKNPGFYGFTVQDMVGLNDRQMTTENVHGKKFDVHVVRKVQLYPLQAGVFTIDAMEVRNKVEFSKSLVTKKTEQEIAEGVYDTEARDHKVNTVEFENNMHTEPVAITVKPVPVKNKPADYAGATGNFDIHADLNKNELARNEEGQLSVTISGKGNFTQLAAPVIAWPAGLEGFEPTIIDSLDHGNSPSRGKRIFKYRFVSAKAGNYSLPAISFCFFKPDSNQFRTLATTSLPVLINHREKQADSVISLAKNSMIGNKSRWWIGGLAGLLIAVAVLYNIAKGNRKPVPAPSISPASTSISVTQALQPAYTFLAADDKMFFTVLRNCIWDFFSQQLGLKGSKISKPVLADAITRGGVGQQSRQRLLNILEHCETGIFTTVEDATDKKKLLDETREVLKDINEQLQRNR